MSHSRTLVVPPVSRTCGGGSLGTSPGRELMAELQRDFGLKRTEPGEHRSRVQLGDCQPPIELKQPNVAMVTRNFETGEKTIRYRDGRVEKRVLGDLEQASIGVPRPKPLRESSKIVLAAAELKLERLRREAQARKTPRQIVEALERRLYGRPQTPSVVPLSDQEYERYQDPAIARPSNYNERWDARMKQQKREVLAKRAAAKRRQHEQEELQASQSMVARII